MAVAGTRTLIKTVVGREKLVPQNLSFAQCGEIAAGAVIVSTVWSALLGDAVNGTVSVNLVLTGSAISSDGKVAQILVTVASTAAVNEGYTLVCDATLDSGEVLTGEISIIISGS